MAPASDPDLLVLHGLRLRSFAAAEAIADITGLPVADVTARLEGFRDKELTRYREGVVTGWMLTPTGRTEAQRLLVEELDAIEVADGLDARGAIDAAYRRFLQLNPTLLQVCTDWQLRPCDGVDEPVLNDHADPDYDQQVVDRLRALDAAVQPVARDLGCVLDRFDGYGARLTAALDKTAAGDADWFTKPTIDSYHTVWFELHENLLATLGIERGQEPVPTSPT